MSPSRLVSIAALLSLALGPSVLADPPAGKKPWAWTLDERLAVRFDPLLIAERQAAEEAHAHAAGAHGPGPQRHDQHRYSIAGDRHPELLLPHELFDSLLTGFAPDDQRRERQRASLRPAMIALGFEEEIFWAKLREAASRYLETYAYPAPGAPVATPSRPYDLCHEAFVALSNARHVFGRERFDRFLYEAVAPATWVASSTTADDPAADLRFVAGGCR